MLRDALDDEREQGRVRVGRTVEQRADMALVAEFVAA
jgi:hypothetical protein